MRRLEPILLAILLATALAYAEPHDSDDDIEEIVVTGDLDSLPGDEIRSVFGFGKTLLETPRSVSTVSDEMMERFIVRRHRRVGRVGGRAVSPSRSSVWQGRWICAGRRVSPISGGCGDWRTPVTTRPPSPPPAGSILCVDRHRPSTDRRRSAAT